MTVGRTEPVPHYAGEVETIDRHREFMRAALGDGDGDVAFAAHCLANAREYMDRADRKGQLENDLAKANFYLDMCAHILLDDQPDPRTARAGWVDPWLVVLAQSERDPGWTPGGNRLIGILASERKRWERAMVAP